MYPVQGSELMAGHWLVSSAVGCQNFFLEPTISIWGAENVNLTMLKDLILCKKASNVISDHLTKIN